MTARIPFDDRVNNQAAIDDFDLGLIREHLQEIKNDLFQESHRMPLPDICRAMYIAKGPVEFLRPVNVGLLFFSLAPERFFSRSWIELVWHQDGSGGKFKEYYFKGPLHKQIRDTLSFLRTNIIAEQVIKRPDKAEADRFYNFPYRALEEILSNAVYHKSYELGSPIEVQVRSDKIDVLSYPGPVPPVDENMLKTQRQIVAREYRNRRIGDFLKELHLTEGRGTGLPTIYDVMEHNGSPAPVFATDGQTYTLVTLKVHPDYQTGSQNGNQVSVGDNVFSINTLSELIAFIDQAANQATNQAINQALTVLDNEVHDRVLKILEQTINWTRREHLFKNMTLSNQTYNRKKFLDPLLHIGWVQLEHPDTSTHPNQRYKITDSGLRLLNLISKK